MEPPPKRARVSDGLQHVNNANGNHIVANPDTTAPAPPPKRGGRPRGNWDVSGRYSLECRSRYQPIDASEYSLKLYYEHDSPKTCMLFGFFEFPNIGLHGGVMRLCPRGVLDGDAARRDNGRLYTDEFDAACVLAEDVRPGSKSKEWLMRWRAEHYDSSKAITTITETAGGHERAQSQFLFRRDPATSLIHVTFSIIHKGKHLLYEGTQLLTADQQNNGDSSHDPGSSQAPTARVLSEWHRLFNPVWEDRALSDTDLDSEQVSSGHNHWERPRTGAMVYARNKPGPNPGFRANEDMSSKLIEERPAWAWDVTGHYLITSPDFDMIVNGPNISSPEQGQDKPRSTISSTPNFRLTVWLENNRWHSKVGRQLWAEFTFGESKGTMRFCPSSIVTKLEKTDRELDIQAFEDACMLETGVWPGIAPSEDINDGQGAIEFGMRWRGYNPCMGLLDGDSSPITLVRFTLSPDGQLNLSGTLKYGMDRIAFIGQKQGSEGAERSGQAVTVNTAWRRFQPRAISLVDYMDFEEPE